MSDKTKIEWSDATWNPVTGCTKVSEGCRNCYAMTFAERFRFVPGHYFETGFDVTLRPDKLDQPLKWKRPRRIFVNSMSDLFHDNISDDYIRMVFAIMAEANWHTFQVLTKRPARMHMVLTKLESWFEGKVFNGSTVSWPLPNVWLGVSVENQKAADERIPLLLQTPAAVQFLSMEPLLGPVNLNHIQVDWVIAGGESGHKARPMHPDWARSLRDQCQAAGVPFFFKQWGEWFPREQWEHNPYLVLPDDDVAYLDSRHTFVFNDDRLVPVHRVGKKAAGRLLDGRTWDEMPKEELVHA